MTAEEQLATFLTKYDPVLEAHALACLARLRAKVAGAHELVYDNYNALVIAFAASERPSDAVFSLALYPRWVTLFFADGARLPDPTGRLSGGGTRFRQLRLTSVELLDAPDVDALFAAALALRPIDPTKPRTLEIRSVSAKQRPRR